MGEGDLRMLGACDGYAHALASLRMHIIAPIDGPYSPGIHPHHTRKLAEKRRRLEPLLRFEAWLKERHSETMAAYRKTTETKEQIAYGPTMTAKKKSNPQPFRRAEDAALAILQIAGKQKPDEIENDALLYDIWEIYKQATILICALMAMRVAEKS